MVAVAVVVLFFSNLCRFVHLSRFASLFHCLVNRSVIQLVSFFYGNWKIETFINDFRWSLELDTLFRILRRVLFFVCLFGRFECILFVQVEFVSPFSKAIPCFDRHSKSPAIIHSWLYLFIGSWFYWIRL